MGGLGKILAAFEKQLKKKKEMLACKLWGVDAATTPPVKSQPSVYVSTQSQSEHRWLPGSPGSPAQWLNCQLSVTTERLFP